MYELKVIEYLEKKWKIACEQHEFHWRSFDRTLIRWISCDSIKTPMEFDRCSHAIFYFFSKYLKIFNYKIKKIQADGCMLNVIVFYLCSGRQSVYYKHQYSKTYTFRRGLNNVNYLNIIKRDHVLATVRTRLHLASGWSNDHSGA